MLGIQTASVPDLDTVDLTRDEVLLVGQNPFATRKVIIVYQIIWLPAIQSISQRNGWAGHSRVLRDCRGRQLAIRPQPAVGRSARGTDRHCQKSVGVNVWTWPKSRQRPKAGPFRRLPSLQLQRRWHRCDLQPVCLSRAPGPFDFLANRCTRSHESCETLNRRGMCLLRQLLLKTSRLAIVRQTMLLLSHGWPALPTGHWVGAHSSELP